MRLWRQLFRWAPMNAMSEGKPKKTIRITANHFGDWSQELLYDVKGIHTTAPVTQAGVDKLIKQLNRDYDLEVTYE